MDAVDQQFAGLESALKAGVGASSDPNTGTNQAAAAAVTPKGANRFTTWMDNAPAAAGGEFYRLYKNLRGQPLDSIQQAVFDQAKQASPGVATATDMLATAPAAMAAAPALGAAGLGGLAASASGLGAVQGGLQGALTADPGHRLGQGLLGAAAGAALPVVGQGLGKLATGLTRTPAAQTLLDRGAQLTPGQMNPGGLFNRIEQASTALPFVGGKIAQAREAVLPQVTRSILSDAAAPGDTLGAGDLNAMVDHMNTGFDNAYSQVHGYPMKPAQVNVKGPDVPLTKAFQNIADRPRLGLTPQQRASMGQQLQDQLNETIAAAKRGGGMMSEHLQALRSQIRDAARDVSPTDNASRAQQGFWDDAQQAVTKALDSQLPPDAAAHLKATDAQYAKFATVQKAVAAGKDKAPTLSQLSTAIKQATPPKLYAAGGGWNRDVTKAATDVLGSTVPMTGLTGAGIVSPMMRGAEGMGGAILGGSALLHPGAAIGTGAGLGGLWSAYTKPGLRALAGQTAPQRAIQGLLDSLNPVLKRGTSLATRSALTQGLLGGARNSGLLQAPAQ